VVTIAQVSLQGDSGAIVLARDPVTVDLLTLADTVRTLAHATTVPSGSYTALRLQVTGAYVEVSQPRGGAAIFASAPDYAGLPAGASVTGTLRLPDPGASGPEATLPEPVAVAGDAHTVVLDFDVAQSFHRVSGVSGEWALGPMLRGIDLAATGRIEITLRATPGVVLPPVEGRVPTLADFNAILDAASTVQVDSARFADPDGDGTYTARFAYQLPGDYTAFIHGPAGLEFAAAPASTTIHLAAGAEASDTFTITSAGPSVSSSTGTPAGLRSR
jgi:hypothetical protein